MELSKEALTAKEQFNDLLGNVMVFDDSDMEQYERCYADVFSDGVNLTYMGLIFFSSYSAEILLAMLTSNPFRKFVIEHLDEEKKRESGSGTYWDPDMNEKRFGVENESADKDKHEILLVANDTFTKIYELNKWFSTEDGKKELDMYCLSNKAIRDMKRIICEYPYLIRRFDFNAAFANEIMEYAGIVHRQIVQVNDKK